MADKLSLKQEAFAKYVASGMTQTDAYLKVYSIKPTTTQETVYSMASRVAKKDKVASRIKALQVEYGDNTPLTSRDDQLRILLRTQSIAESHLQKTVVGYDKDGNLTEQAVFSKAAADTIVRTAEAINKMCGFNEPEKVESDIIIEFANKLDEDLIR